jgi:uncharacterized coiled-coil protein SlyX
MPEAEDALTQTERHVREGEERLARQAALIGRLAARGLDTAEAETILERLRTTLELSREHLARLRATEVAPPTFRSGPTMSGDRDGAFGG